MRMRVAYFHAVWHGHAVARDPPCSSRGPRAVTARQGRVDTTPAQESKGWYVAIYYL